MHEKIENNMNTKHFECFHCLVSNKLKNNLMSYSIFLLCDVMKAREELQIHEKHKNNASNRDILHFSWFRNNLNQ